ncbi:putative baseplate assembly protein [Variovorax sp. J22R115]|uniref:putative baseplate assembly protein n=1 Tax=Variovorax sp. J22R115 TaxID=3053509 RepID=UPI002577C0FF|nr:putative baseplate assembly protein [Variovorax sp. J22R115]MDM0047919.1 putative baseplate assembly protein [Variovorax sp. J22R115]
MKPPAAPLVIDRPRSAEQIAAALRRLLEREGFAPTPSDPLLEALVGVAARYAEIVTGCVNEAPRLHLQAFSEFVAGRPRPASAASVHLAFGAAPGVAPVVVPRHTRVAAAPASGDTAPVVFETADDLNLVRAHLVQVWYVDPGHRRVADLAAMLAAPGRGEADPMDAALPVARACHFAQREAFGLSGLREVRVRARIASGPPRDPELQLEWGVVSDQGFVPLAVRSDTTQQMTHDGEVVLEPPPAWPTLAIEGLESRWLSVRPSGPALLAGANAPPRVAHVSLLVLAAVPLQPIVAACHGPAPLDISKDFYPLGERPRFGDVFHVLCPALVEPGAHIELRVQMTNPQGAASSPIPPVSRDGKPLVAWEIPTANGYRALVAADGTRSLTQDGTVVFTVPADVVSTTIAGQSGVWLRARLVSGNFGSVAVADAGGLSIPCAPSIRALAAEATLERGPMAPDLVICEGALTRKVLDRATAVPFDLFIAPDVDGPALYLGLAAPGVPLEAVLAAGRVLNLHVRPAPPTLPITLDDGAPAVAHRWQVRGAGTWREVDVVRDDSNGMARSGIVRLRLSHDASPWTGLALDPLAQLGWLRVSWPDAIDAVRTLPLGLALNAVAATHIQTLRNEVLGSSNGRASQAFKALRTPIIGGVLLQVREHDDPWVPWEEVDDLSDSTAASRHFTLDRQTGELRFGDGRQGRIPPAGANNIVLLAYAAGGGRQGNRPPLSITLPQSAVPGVESVVNLEPASGGIDAETRSQVRARASTWLRHRDRAVCAPDYADLALAASPEVARAYCFAGRDLVTVPRGAGATVEPSAAVISLIVIPHSDTARPQPDAALLATVKAYLDARRFPAGRLVIVGPAYASVSVKLEISVHGHGSPHEVAMQCQKRVAQFLHPLTGGSRGQGWAPGERPHRSDLYSLLGAIDGVDLVHALSLDIDAMPGVPFIVAAGTVQTDIAGIAP